MRRYAFTMLELVFVIIIMGILGKFGTEFLAQAYQGFIFSKINNELQAEAEMAVESIAARLQYRIKASTIGRISSDGNFTGIQSASGDKYDILEWVGSDIEDFRGITSPQWSSIIDLDESNATFLFSPETNTSEINNTIVALSDNNATINDSALYFIGATSNQDDYGWSFDDGAFTDQSKAMHPIKSDDNISAFIPENASDGSTNSFSGEDVYEYYQLAWSAYAVGIADYNETTKMGTLKIYYNYQPWEGDDYNGTKTDSQIIMNNVSTFRFRAVGSLIKIQVCVKSDLIEDEKYSICKEKTVY